MNPKYSVLRWALGVALQASLTRSPASGCCAAELAARKFAF
jgi:hypothetical protein